MGKWTVLQYSVPVSWKHIKTKRTFESVLIKKSITLWTLAFFYPGKCLPKHFLDYVYHHLNLRFIAFTWKCSCWELSLFPGVAYLPAHQAHLPQPPHPNSWLQSFTLNELNDVTITPRFPNCCSSVSHLLARWCLWTELFILVFHSLPTLPSPQKN